MNRLLQSDVLSYVKGKHENIPKEKQILLIFLWNPPWSIISHPECLPTWVGYRFLEMNAHTECLCRTVRQVLTDSF